MRFRRRTRSFGSQANAAVEGLTSRVDDRTGEVARRTATAITLAVRLLRVPSALVLVLSTPSIVLTLVGGLAAGGSVGVVLLVAGAAMALVAVAFGVRRHRILRAVDDPDALAGELRVMINLSGKVDETRGALAEIAGAGGWRLMSRLRGVWHGARMTGGWVDAVGDLPRARYFAPPKVGTTVTLTVAALWLVPVSAVVALLAAVGALAS